MMDRVLLIDIAKGVCGVHRVLHHDRLSWPACVRKRRCEMSIAFDPQERRRIHISIQIISTRTHKLPMTGYELDPRLSADTSVLNGLHALQHCEVPMAFGPPGLEESAQLALYSVLGY